MNLADIRKKAEESKKSAAVSAEVPAESAILPEMAAADTLVFAEPSLDNCQFPLEELHLEAAGWDDAAAFASAAAPPESMSELAPEPAPESEHGFVSEAAPEAAAEIDAGPEISQPAQSAAVSSGKSASGYNALETILAGREMSAAAEDDAGLRSLPSTADDLDEYLCFRVAHEWYAISIMSIKEIVKPREVTDVPRMPAFILGVISLRGVIIPVMDMRLRLSLPVNQPTGRERIIVLRMETGFCGILVDEVIQVASIQKSCIEEPPAVLDGIDRDFVSGLGHFDSRMLIILNLGTILDAAVH